jgi:hypothetical protein
MAKKGAGDLYDDMDHEPEMDEGFSRNNKKKRKFSVKDEPHNTNKVDKEDLDHAEKLTHSVPKEDRKRMAVAVMKRKMAKHRTRKM